MLKQINVFHAPALKERTVLEFSYQTIHANASIFHISLCRKTTPASVLIPIPILIKQQAPAFLARILVIHPIMLIFKLELVNASQTSLGITLKIKLHVFAHRVQLSMLIKLEKNSVSNALD